MATYLVFALTVVACIVAVQPVSGMSGLRHTHTHTRTTKTVESTVTKQGLAHAHQGKDTREAVASVLTNGGISTLQGLPGSLSSGGLPFECNIPQCSRSEQCQGEQCCSTQMFHALSEITGWMEKNSVEYVILDGTLLGAYRDMDIIPWTADVDIGIYAKDVAKLIAQQDIPWNFAYKPSFGIPRGCEDGHPGFPGNYSKVNLTDSGFCSEGHLNLFCSYYIDLYVIDSPDHGGMIANHCLSQSQHRPDGKLITTTVEVRGKEFVAPSNIEACLVAVYGPSWRSPVKKSGW